MLLETGNCAASVFKYSCLPCGPDCSTVSITNSTLTDLKHPGLGEGLQSCQVRFDYIRSILSVGTGLYVVVVAAFMWYQQIACCVPKGTF